jgi:hypothetical protein
MGPAELFDMVEWEMHPMAKMLYPSLRAKFEEIERSNLAKQN